MKRLIFEIILFICDLFGLNTYFRSKNKDMLRILMYHGVTEEAYDPAYWLLVPEQNFREQMQHLTKYYDVIPASQILNAPKNSTLSKAVVSFDDGLANVLTVASPILNEFGVPAICFVVPGLAEKQEEIFSEAIFNLIMTTDHRCFDLTEFELGKWDLPATSHSRTKVAIALNRMIKMQPPETIKSVRTFLLNRYSGDQQVKSPFKLMTVDQIKQFASKDNFEVGAHTNDHLVLTSLSASEQEHQIAASVHKLSEWGITVSKTFCYPSGEYDDNTIKISKKLGIKGAFATTDGLHNRTDNTYEMKRVSVGNDTSLYEFKARMSGLYYSLIRMIGID